MIPLRPQRTAVLALLLALCPGPGCGGGPAGGTAPVPAGCPPVQEPVHNEPWRPWVHFTPEENWMNDPNGLVFFRGEYHLFYQHQPEIPFFGAMHWGHAVSRDLVHWERLPVALAPDPVRGQAYSGSAVVDRRNTSGLCRGAPGEAAECPVFLFTRHGGVDREEKQDLAYSNDGGRTLDLYERNPVLPNRGGRDFRDPKVFWHEPAGRWVMVLAAGDRVQFFASPDLLEWSWLSDFGPAGTEPGVWECPDLFELPVDGLAGETRWVLKVDYNPGVVIRESGAQFFVGRFDGTRFLSEQAETRRVDFGADFYAAQSWAGAAGGRRVWIAWMNNWRYALFTPTAPWRGSMTVPREVRLWRHGEEIALVQRPAPELESLRRCLLYRAARPAEIRGEADLSDRASGETLEIRAVLDVRQAARAGLRVRVSPDRSQATEIAYDVPGRRLSVDRGRSGALFSERFSGLHAAPLVLEDGLLDLHVLVDRSSVELFAAGGRVAMTDLIFPGPESRGIVLFSEGGPAVVRALEIHALGPIW